MNLFRSAFLLGIPMTCCTLQAQWVPMASGHQSVRSVTTGPGAIYMVSYPNGVFKSVNDGASWDPANTGLPLSGSNIFAESIGYDGALLFCGTESGIYKSADAAASWTPANTGAPAATSTNYANKIYHVPGSTTTLAIYSAMISGGGGISRTTDGGVNWFSGNGGLSSNMIVYQVAQINNILYAATSTGIMTSSNLAVSWTPLNANSNFQTFGIQGTPTNLVVVSTFGFRRSLNNGASWTTTMMATPTKGEMIQYDGKYWAIMGTSTTSVYRSTNSGANWAVYNTGLGAVDAIAQEEFHASGTHLYLGCLQDIYSHTGTTVDAGEIAMNALPVPYPTVFNEGFTVDLGTQPAGNGLVLIDAMGREVQRRSNLPSGPVRVDREGLAPGTYRLMLVDAHKGTMRSLGAVIAE
ncbi:MAG TPA: hypothetical protein VKG92_02310 [Flavobacteriales bacterium]|nr:hypothetical protein [Flavobacteriales bacterium]